MPFNFVLERGRQGIERGGEQNDSGYGEKRIQNQEEKTE
jgi:hypothetical protein